ncbi:MAG: sigma-70 family RNA polymerase sigma factor [Armatimonadetes bacterium]|nr:sigma-70 family RNA polymerase sigma factor [Armatimonadota bacterium]
MRYCAPTHDPAARDPLVRACEPLVRGIASDYRNPGHEEDLVQVGFLGLLNAIEHFDPSRGTPFQVLARHFIRGEIRHYLRDHASVLRRPRWLDQVSGQIEQAVGAHLGENGRYPGLAELAEMLSMDEESLTKTLKTRQVVRTISLDVDDECGQPRVDADSAGRPRTAWLEVPVEDRMMLIEALETLNPIQRVVVFYIFFTDLTQSECAARVADARPARDLTAQS